jgi:hypothetical protein
MSKLWREPTLIEVEVNGEQPAALRVNGQRHQVQTIETRWRVDERWRGGPARDYFLVVTDRGMWGIVYQDLVTRSWFLQGVYD